MDFYSAPIMTDTITDVANWAQRDAGYAQPAREQIWDASSSQLADWIIEDANQQAAEITREARNQASSSLAEAHQEAAELVRRTGEQAKLTIQAAELQAAEIRATMMKLTTDLTGMAAYVTQNLSPAPPACACATQPAQAPAPSAFAPPDVDAAADRSEPRSAAGPGPAAEPGRAGTGTLGPGGRGRRGPGRPPQPAARPAHDADGPAGGQAQRQVPPARGRARDERLHRRHGPVRPHRRRPPRWRCTDSSSSSSGRPARARRRAAAFRKNQGPGQPDAPGAHQQLQKP